MGPSARRLSGLSPALSRSERRFLVVEVAGSYDGWASEPASTRAPTGHIFTIYKLGPGNFPSNKHSPAQSRGQRKWSLGARTRAGDVRGRNKRARQVGGGGSSWARRRPRVSSLSRARARRSPAASASRKLLNNIGGFEVAGCWAQLMKSQRWPHKLSLAWRGEGSFSAPPQVSWLADGQIFCSRTRPGPSRGPHKPLTRNHNGHSFASNVCTEYT